MAKLPMQMEGLDLKIPSANNSYAINSNGDSVTLTSDALVIGGVLVPSSSGSTYAQINPPTGNPYFLFYPSNGSTGMGLQFVEKGSTITLTITSGAQAYVRCYPISNFFNI